MIVVDTSVWIGYFRGDGTPQTELLDRRIADDLSIALTDIVLTEILQGLPDDRAVERVEQQLTAHDIFELGGLEDHRRAASLFRTSRRRGVTIRRTLDCLIASVCVREDLPVLHDDADFDHLANHTDLRVVAA